MTREEMANALLRDAQGLDGQGYDATMNPDSFGADDPISRGGLSTLAIQFSIANAASLDVALFSQEHLDNAALPTGLASPAIANYKALLRYLQANPSQVRSILLASSEASSSAPVLASMSLSPTRSTPFGLSASNQLLVQSFQTTQDFQANRITIPVSLTVDAFSYIRVQSGVNGSGGAITINATILFGVRREARKMVPAGQPLVVRPGGRGPASI